MKVGGHAKSSFVAVIKRHVMKMCGKWRCSSMHS